MPEKEKAASPRVGARGGETVKFHPDKNEAELTSKSNLNDLQNQHGIAAREPVVISRKQLHLPGLEPTREIANDRV